ncbi:hypothetical protein V865_003527 [Kwoniella europaea PYCC6329]|uniref:Uncharacterized protein n=1 Tax=Kwoniella europaea PYCC6329 TaxID=1423913 RepID=A0AAX4KGD0_9TREE
MTSEAPSFPIQPQETEPQISFIERLFRLYPIQGNHHQPPPTSRPALPSQNVRQTTSVDIRALEAFLGPIGRPREQRREGTVQPTTGDIEAQRNEQWIKLTIRQVIRSNPRRMVFLSTLFTLLVGIIVGWVIFINRMARLSKSKNEEGEEKDKSGVDTLIMVGDGCFILILLTTLFFILRYSLKIYAHFHPPSSPVPSQSGDTTMTEAPWTLPPLPTYVNAVGREQRTGDVEDQYIAGECPPKYGDERGSKLLLRSISRMAEDQGLDGRQGRMEVITQSVGQDNVQNQNQNQNRNQNQHDGRGLEIQLDNDDTQIPNHRVESVNFRGTSE